MPGQLQHIDDQVDDPVRKQFLQRVDIVRHPH